ncbi:MAG TPA: hypothetical protein IAB65_04615 [Candidatus Onthocola stercorigallinarum]|nr:hypothetical protein [Candidatus Onthocola stercorigallinarum]
MYIDNDEKYVTIGKTIFEFDNVPENDLEIKMIVNRYKIYADMDELACYRNQLYEDDLRKEIPKEEIIKKLDEIILNDFNNLIENN